MNFSLIGGILLIVGTSIGAGMLALPVATAQLGWLGSVVMLMGCWLVMTTGAFLILEVNLRLPQRSNLISMAGATLGPLGQIIAWCTYLLLLYSLLCAYIAGGSDLSQYLFSVNGMQAPWWLAACAFTLVFSLVVYLGIRAVDYINRGLMIVKLGAYLVLICLLLPFVNTDQLLQGYYEHLASTTALTVTITSFGFAIIIPSLRVYFASDIKKLRLAILIGSLIPLICYILWDLAIMGVIPLSGDNGLLAIMQSSNTTSELVRTLTTSVNDAHVTTLAKLFTSICVLTSFLGVALCLTDFFADGLSLEKKGLGAVTIHLLTFLPPLLIVIFFPHVFIGALKYAGIYCIILLIIFPALMAFQARKKNRDGFVVVGGNLVLTILLGLGGIVIIKSLWDMIWG